MGIVQELYRVSDSDIDMLINISPESAEEYLSENYSYVYGKYHLEGDTHFYLDKAWHVVHFLFLENDWSESKSLQYLEGTPLTSDGTYFIKSREVKIIYNILFQIPIENLKNSVDIDRMEREKIYRFQSAKNWEHIEYYVNEMLKAFKKASECGDGLIKYFC
jgi:hypothetical protein